MPFRILGIDHVQLAAPLECEAEARAFFSGILGMHEMEKPEPLRGRGGVWFRCGNTELHIGIEKDFAPAKKAHPAFRVQDLNELREHLEASGVTVTPDAALEGIERFFVSDPFGNRLEFLERKAG